MPDSSDQYTTRTPNHDQILGELKAVEEEYRYNTAHANLMTTLEGAITRALAAGISESSVECAWDEAMASQERNK